MDKEKEIAEIEDIISCCWNTISAAQKLYNAGYRKVPDGAVVLLIGENNQALDEKTIEYFVKHNEQIRKETAEYILQMFEVWEDKPYVSKEDFKRSIADLFGVEIKEYEK